MEGAQSEETAARSSTRFGDESSAKEGSLCQKNVHYFLFSNKLIINLEKEKMLESRREERERQKR